MSTALWLQVASVWALLFTAGHTMGARKDWSPFGDSDVLKAMRNVRFDFQGVSRTYLDFYVGFGYTLSVFSASGRRAVAVGDNRQDPGGTGPADRRNICARVARERTDDMEVHLPVPAAFGAILTVLLALAYFATS